MQREQLNLGVSKKRFTALNERITIVTVILLTIYQLYGCSSARSLQRSGNTSTPSLSTSTAFAHSYGFFDNIPDDEWLQFYHNPVLHSEHYRWEDDHEKKALETPHAWIFSNWDPYFQCPHLQKIGGLGGASKWVCDPERIPRVVNRRQTQTRLDTRRNRIEVPCLVYSIGSNGNYRFEDDLRDLGLGCEIHVFDPGSFAREEAESSPIVFHQWGLGSSYSKKYMEKRIGKGTFLPFQTIKTMLGHENRTIDIFKIDCEGCEWHTQHDWIKADIHQILIETHDLPTMEKEKRTPFGIFPAMTATSFFDAFQENGFVLFSKEVNTFNGLGRCAEWSFLKMHPDFFRKRT